MLLRMVEPPANLGVVILVVSRTARDFDLSYVGMFRPVSGPLDHSPRLNDAGNDPVHQLKFGDLEVGHPLVAFANASANVEDCLFVFVEEL